MITREHLLNRMTAAVLYIDRWQWETNDNVQPTTQDWNSH